MTNYVMSVEKDEDGYWLADFVDVPGCHTQARSVAELLTRARDALASFVGDDDADTAVLDVDLVGVDERTRQNMANYTATRDAVRAEEIRRQRDLAHAARDLRDQGLTLRDIAALADVSHSRVKQLLDQLDADAFAELPSPPRVQIRQPA